MNPKQFALEAITPYFNNPELCGFDGDHCRYITEDGKKCVAGKYMLPAVLNSAGGSIGTILRKFNLEQSRVFIPEAVGILSTQQWEYLQAIHDRIARGDDFDKCIENLNLFSYDELKEYAETLKCEPALS